MDWTSLVASLEEPRACETYGDEIRVDDHPELILEVDDRELVIEADGGDALSEPTRKFVRS